MIPKHSNPPICYYSLSSFGSALVGGKAVYMAARSSTHFWSGENPRSQEFSQYFLSTSRMNHTSAVSQIPETIIVGKQLFPSLSLTQNTESTIRTAVTIHQCHNIYADKVHISLRTLSTCIPQFLYSNTPNTDPKLRPGKSKPMPHPRLPRCQSKIQRTLYLHDLHQLLPQQSPLTQSLSQQRPPPMVRLRWLASPPQHHHPRQENTENKKFWETPPLPNTTRHTVPISTAPRKHPPHNDNNAPQPQPISPNDHVRSTFPQKNLHQSANDLRAHPLVGVCEEGSGEGGDR